MSLRSELFEVGEKINSVSLALQSPNIIVRRNDIPSIIQELQTVMDSLNKIQNSK
jgi:hypothetical protein